MRLFELAQEAMLDRGGDPEVIRRFGIVMVTTGDKLWLAEIPDHVREAVKDTLISISEQVDAMSPDQVSRIVGEEEARITAQSRKN